MKNNVRLPENERVSAKQTKPTKKAKAGPDPVNYGFNGAGMTVLILKLFSTREKPMNVLQITEKAKEYAVGADALQDTDGLAEPEEERRHTVPISISRMTITRNVQSLAVSAQADWYCKVLFGGRIRACTPVRRSGSVNAVPVYRDLSRAELRKILKINSHSDSASDHLADPVPEEGFEEDRQFYLEELSRAASEKEREEVRRDYEALYGRPLEKKVDAEPPADTGARLLYYFDSDADSGDGAIETMLTMIASSPYLNQRSKEELAGRVQLLHPACVQEMLERGTATGRSSARRGDSGVGNSVERCSLTAGDIAGRGLSSLSGNESSQEDPALDNFADSLRILTRFLLRKEEVEIQTCHFLYQGKDRHQYDAIPTGLWRGVIPVTITWAHGYPYLIVIPLRKNKGVYETVSDDPDVRRKEIETLQHKQFRACRADRIYEVRPLLHIVDGKEEPVQIPAAIQARIRRFDPRKEQENHSMMQTGAPVRCEFLILDYGKNEKVDEIVRDYFGSNVEERVLTTTDWNTWLQKEDPSNQDRTWRKFCVHTAPRGMLYFAKQYLSRVILISPEHLSGKVKDEIQAALERY